MIRRIQDILEMAAQGPRRVLAVAAPHEEAILRAVAQAARRGFAQLVLFGQADRIRKLASDSNISLERDVNIVPAADGHEAIDSAVAAVHEKRADILVKGLVPTSALLRSVIEKELGRHTGSLLSHVAVFDAPAYDRLMILTDAGVNIAPDVDAKVRIVRNAVAVAKALGMPRPRVAMLAAVDRLNYPAMKATLDAALVSRIARSGVIPDAAVAGPYALDNAVSPAAARTKDNQGEVAGQADILCAPEIETANVLYKALQSFCRVTFASVVVGAPEPLAVSSRSDSEQTKLLSIALACLLCARDRPQA